MTDYSSINESILNGDFSSFNKLNEDEQVEVKKTWTEEMWCKYYTQDTMSEKEFLDSIIKGVKGSYKGNV